MIALNVKKDSGTSKHILSILKHITYYKEDGRTSKIKPMSILWKRNHN